MSRSKTSTATYRRGAQSMASARPWRQARRRAPAAWRCTTEHAPPAAPSGGRTPGGLCVYRYRLANKFRNIIYNISLLYLVVPYCRPNTWGVMYTKCKCYKKGLVSRKRMTQGIILDNLCHTILFSFNVSVTNTIEICRFGFTGLASQNNSPWIIVGPPMLLSTLT